MPSSDRDSIAAEVRAELTRQRKTQRDAAKILGLPQQSVQMRLKGATPFRAEELAKLANGLGVPVSKFFPSTVTAA